MTNPVSRRQFLRGLGVSIALPALQAARQPTPRRAILICNNLSLLPKLFFPSAAGRGYELTPYLKELAPFRDRFTVFSGLSHPGVNGGHPTDNCFLTAAKGPGRAGFRNGISIDQYAAAALGQKTRFPSLNLGVNVDRANRSLSWTRDGVLIPAEDSPSALFSKMFVAGTPAERERRLHEIQEGGTILDAIHTELRQLSGKAGKEDRQRIDQYFTSIRELEQGLHSAADWEQRPKPAATAAPPQDPPSKAQMFDRIRHMFALAHLAVESDSTRIITLMIDGFTTPVYELDGRMTSNGYHNLTHHGQTVEKLAELEQTDYQHMKHLRTLLEKLAASRLLDDTMVLYGSNMGDANTHDNANLPILLAGGGFKHGQHLAFKHDNNTPLCNLYVNMLQRLGVETDKFASSTGTISEI